MQLGLYMATQWRQGADLGPELANLIAQTRAAKAAGLKSLMVGQHFVSSPLQMFQAMPLLARLAAEAEGMRLGPGLLLLPLLNPVIVAEETATLDWLTGGNAIVGLGLGYRAEEFASIGVPFKERVPRFVEGVEVIRKLWRDDTVNHRGRFHTVEKVQASIRPKQKGGPPIWMAGDVEPAILRAAKLGDAWMPSPMVSETDMARFNALFRETRAAAGLPPAVEYPVIREAQAAGEVSKKHDPARLANVLVMLWEGATIRMQIDRSLQPVDDFLDFARPLLAPNRRRQIEVTGGQVVAQLERHLLPSPFP